MANLTATSVWSDVPQHETTTIVRGGAGGEMNLQAQALLNRTVFLDDKINSNTPIGRQSFFMSVSEGIYARTTGGAAAGSIETATNKVMVKTLDFDSASTEYAQFVMRMPKAWNGGEVQAQFVWAHGATATDFGVAWGIQALALENGDALEGAFGTAVYAVDTGGATDTVYVSGETADITPSGTVVDESLLVFQVLRKHDDAGDTMAVDARLIGITIYYTVSAATDD